MVTDDERPVHQPGVAGHAQGPVLTLLSCQQGRVTDQAKLQDLRGLVGQAGPEAGGKSGMTTGRQVEKVA